MINTPLNNIKTYFEREGHFFQVEKQDFQQVSIWFEGFIYKWSTRQIFACLPRLWLVALAI